MLYFCASLKKHTKLCGRFTSRQEHTMKTITLAKTAVAAAIAGVPLAASAVQLEDYLIANSSYEEAFFNANLNASDSARNEQIAYDFNMNARYQKTFTTLPRSWGYTLTGFANACLLYTSPSPRDQRGSRMPSSA